MMDPMDFGGVVEVLNDGFAAKRAGWSNQFIYLAPVRHSTMLDEPLASLVEEGDEVKFPAHILFMTPRGDVVPWPAPHVDLLAQDWVAL